jgi:hypothetical protein
MDKPTPQHPMDLPAEQAAKLVKRMAPEFGADGKPAGKDIEVEIGADEVFANRVRGDVITVVTTAGEKLTGKAPAGKAGK